MKTARVVQIGIAIAVGGTIAACAQIEGLDHFHDLDCLGDCPDAAPGSPDATTGHDAAIDTKPTCPPCSGATPVCDPVSLKCVECLPGTLACAVGQFCDPDVTAGYHCVQGCNVANDCVKAFDAGIVDGSVGDGGTPTFECCNSRCTDTTTNAAHCGSCGHACVTGEGCCNSLCTDVVSDESDCGGCGKVCSGNHVPTTACSVGKCVGGCETGFDDCNANKLGDGCEADIYNDPTKCGGCTKVCSSNHVPTPTCAVGSCDGTCEAGWTDCNNNKLVDGCEVSLSTDPLHCGSCPNVCSNNHITTPTCAGSVCNGTCNAGFKDCNANKLADGCETNIDSSATDCGDCGKVCSNNHVPTPTCLAGSCNGACQAGFGDCNADRLADGCETNLAIDPDHCNTCVNTCSSNHMATRTCSGGACNGTCRAPFVDCNGGKLADGCEGLVGVDTNNCSACGSVCAANKRHCVGGTCTTGYGQTFPPLAFVDACAQAGAVRVLANTDDGATAPIALPFAFTYYAAAQTQFWLSTNGVLGFGGTPDSSCCGFTCLPTTNDPFPAVLAYASDLVTGAGGVCYATIGAAGSRHLVVTWDHVHLFSNAGADIHFSVMLDETTNRIDVIYDLLGGATGAGLVIGLQGPGAAQGTEYSCHVGTVRAVAPGDAIVFIP